VATMGALGASVNLVTATSAYWLEMDWSPMTLVQSEKRHHRHGNTASRVYSNYLAIEGTADQRMTDVLIEKMRETLAVLGHTDPTVQFLGMLTAEEPATGGAALEAFARQFTTGDYDDPADISQHTRQ